jgi:hypothetical protein
MKKNYIFCLVISTNLCTLNVVVNITGVPGNDNNGAGSIGWSGFSTLFFVLGSMVFY